MSIYNEGDKPMQNKITNPYGDDEEEDDEDD